jgi:exo-beta-1,3-glucanase (GH17 family)
VWETAQAQDVIEWYDENGKFLSWGYAAEATPPPDSRVDLSYPADAPPEPQATYGIALDVHVTVDMALEIESEELEQASDQESAEQLVAVVAGHPADQVSEQPPFEEPTIEEPTNVYDHISQPELSPPGYGPPSEPAPVDDGKIQDAPSDEVIYNGGLGLGIGWSNYNGDSTCKTRDQADAEWARFGDFDVVRVYGVDCGQPGMALELALKYGKRVFVGLYFLDDRFDSQITDIISHVAAVGAGWDIVDTISVGNEDVHRGAHSPGEVIGYVQAARARFRGAGYNGPVVHVDSQNEVLANPELCSEAAGEYIAANVHPFFNSQTDAHQAGDFVAGQIEMLRNCGANQRRRRQDVRVRVVEVGWPKSGDPNGFAVPSKENQIAALESIKSKGFDSVILFSAYDHEWMQDGPGTFNTEKFWGILD